MNLKFIRTIDLWNFGLDKDMHSHHLYLSVLSQVFLIFFICDELKFSGRHSGLL